MAIPNQRGFAPVRHLSGGQTFSSVRRPLRGTNINQIYPGDPVRIDASGHIQRATLGTAASAPWLGVVKATYGKDQRPRTHSLPENNAYAVVSSSGWVDIYEDPNIIFVVNCSASISPFKVGQFINIVINSPVTAANMSGYGVNEADCTATAIGHPLKIVRISPQDPLTANADPAGEANNDVEVLIMQHMWRLEGRTYVVQEHAA